MIASAPAVPMPSRLRIRSVYPLPPSATARLTSSTDMPVSCIAFSSALPARAALLDSMPTPARFLPVPDSTSSHAFHARLRLRTPISLWTRMLSRRAAARSAAAASPASPSAPVVPAAAMVSCSCAARALLAASARRSCAAPASPAALTTAPIAKDAPSMAAPHGPPSAPMSPRAADDTPDIPAAATPFSVAPNLSAAPCATSMLPRSPPTDCPATTATCPRVRPLWLACLNASDMRPMAGTLVCSAAIAACVVVSSLPNPRASVDCRPMASPNPDTAPLALPTAVVTPPVAFVMGARTPAGSTFHASHAAAMPTSGEGSAPSSDATPSSNGDRTPRAVAAP